MAHDPVPPAGGLAGPSADVAIDDWVALFCAVKDRLRQAVGESLNHSMNGSAMQVRTDVLECVEALDQLHSTLKHVVNSPTLIELRDTAHTRDERAASRSVRLNAAAGAANAALASAPTPAVAATGRPTGLA